VQHNPIFAIGRRFVNFIGRAVLSKSNSRTRCAAG
jgi:hypothetical protein